MDLLFVMKLQHVTVLLTMNLSTRGYSSQISSPTVPENEHGVWLALSDVFFYFMNPYKVTPHLLMNICMSRSSSKGAYLEVCTLGNALMRTGEDKGFDFTS